MKPVTVITGASAGIGAELARVFAGNGHALMLVARREDRLRELAAELSSVEVVPLALDLSAPDAADRIAAALQAHALDPQFVVNNAGFGLIGKAAELPIADQLNMIDLNVRALTALSLRFVDRLAENRGGLLNVASVASFLPGPGAAVYYAGKAYVRSFTEALHQELLPRGVRVCCLCPGPVDTEFQARAGVAPGTAPGVLDVPAAEVAAQGYRGLMANQRIVVPGWGNKAVTVLAGRLMPRGPLMRMVEARQVRRTST